MLKQIIAALGALAVFSLCATPAPAQLLDQLKGVVGGATKDGGGLTGGMPSVSQASPSNIAGVLQYCVKNNYLSGGSASSVKDTLLGKVTGSGRAASDPQYTAGTAGKLESGGQSFSLGGGGLKQQATKKVCDLVLQHAKSLI